jgi:hypothetical protein
MELRGLHHHCCDERRPHGIHDFDPTSYFVQSIYGIAHQMLPTAIEQKKIDKTNDILNWWYACRQMTIPEDMFPAFSGLATEFASRTGYRWKAGIWVEDFRRGLLWETGLCSRTS